MARRPEAWSWKNVTCSWPVPRSNTLTEAPHSFFGAGGRESRVVATGGGAAVTGCGHDEVRAVIAFAAHLRIYEPLGALPEDERQHWAAYVEDGSCPSRPVLMAREHEVALAAAMATPPRTSLSVDPEPAYVRHLDGLTYVCPWRLQLRA